MKRDSRRERQLVQETIGYVAVEPTDVRGREIHVRSQAGIIAQVEGNVRKRLGRRYVPASVAARAFFPQELG
jgi:hypothetical protein